ncbi:MAG TPA: hypothetical protein VEZ90_05515, partial [Blastocatellia bacterium]|nr:hypothetical protein [Blastocatellia bacterium]
MATKSNNEIQSSKPQKHLALEGQLPLRDELKVECEVMIKYAMASGFSLPPAAVQALQILSDCTQPDQDQCGDLKQLALAHEQLTQIVAPATPRTLL